MAADINFTAAGEAVLYQGTSGKQRAFSVAGDATEYTWRLLVSNNEGVSFEPIKIGPSNEIVQTGGGGFDLSGVPFDSIKLEVLTMGTASSITVKRVPSRQ